MNAPTQFSELPWLRRAGVAAGIVLSLIGLRFLIVPESAAHFFGIDRLVTSHELHAVIGIRDVWLGLLAIVFAWRSDWRALGLWFMLAAGVCVADFVVVLRAGGAVPPLAFHAFSGLFCGAFAIIAARASSTD